MENPLDRWGSKGPGDEVAEAMANAAREGDEPRLRGLLKTSGNPFRRDLSGRSPGHWAAETGNAGCVRLLVEHGWDPSERHPGGWAGVHLAALYGRVEALEALKEAGADMEALTPGHGTAESIARGAGREAAANRLASWREASELGAGAKGGEAGARIRGL